MGDKQMDGFQVLHNVAANDILYSVIHASPLADRDFLSFHALFRHEQGNGLAFYTRFADESFFTPPCRAVRAKQYVLMTEIMQDADVVTFTTTTAMDPQIPWLPKWIMNWLVPSEFRKWVSAVENRCGELARAGIKVPCATLLAEKSSTASDTEEEILNGSPVKTVTDQTLQHDMNFSPSLKIHEGKGCATIEGENMPRPDTSRSEFPVLLGSPVHADFAESSTLSQVLEDDPVVTDASQVSFAWPWCVTCN